MPKHDLILHALTDHIDITTEYCCGPDLKYVATLVDKANFADEIIEFIYDDIFDFIPDEYRPKHNSSMIDGFYLKDERKSTVIKYLKHINDKGE